MTDYGEQETRPAPERQEVRCKCEQPAVRECVKKYGPTQGQLFWTCALPWKAPGRCNFFRWVDEREGKRLSFKGRRPQYRFQPYVYMH